MYSDGERNIFTYEVDGKTKFADPISAFRKISEYPGIDIESDLKRIDSDLVDSPDMESLGKITNATRFAFGLLEFDGETGEGVLDAEVQEIFTEFIFYMAAIAKKKSQTPTSPPSMDSEESQTTKPTSDSGSTETGS